MLPMQWVGCSRCEEATSSNVTLSERNLREFKAPPLMRGMFLQRTEARLQHGLGLISGTSCPKTTHVLAAPTKSGFLRSNLHFTTKNGSSDKEPRGINLPWPGQCQASGARAPAEPQGDCRQDRGHPRGAVGRPKARFLR